MNKTQEALRMAIEALEEYVGVVQHKFNAETWGDIEDGGKPARDAIQACKEALEQPAQSIVTVPTMIGSIQYEQPAQEPVAWMSEGGIFTRTKEHAEIWSNNGGKVTPVYTHPAPSWQGLSDDEMMEIWCSDEVESTLDFGRAIEQALKEKNT